MAKSSTTFSRERTVAPIAVLRGLQFFDFRAGGCDVRFELTDFVRIIHLLLGAGQSLLQVVDFLAQQLDAFGGFFVHGVSFRLSAASKNLGAKLFRQLAGTEFAGALRAGGSAVDFGLCG